MDIPAWHRHDGCSGDLRGCVRTAVVCHDAGRTCEMAMVKQTHAADPRRHLAILGLLLAACSGAPNPPASVAPSAAPSASPIAQASATPHPLPVERTANVIASIRLDGVRDGAEIAAGDDSVWIRLVDGSVARVDASTNAVVAKIPVGHGEFGAVAVGDGGVWVTTFDENKLSRIDPATNKVVAEIKLGANPGAILVTPAAIWVSNHRGGTISRVDPATNKVVATISVGPAKPSGPASIWLVGSDLWVAVPNISSIVRIDPSTNQSIAEVKVPGLFGLLVAGDAVYGYGIRSQLYQIATDTNTVAKKFSPAYTPWAYGAGAFWGSDGKDLLRSAGPPFDNFERWRVAGQQSEDVNYAFDDRSIWLLNNDGAIVRIELPA